MVSARVEARYFNGQTVNGNAQSARELFTVNDMPLFVCPKWRKERIVKQCPVCKKEFKLLPCRNAKRFCSRRCAVKGRKKAKFPDRRGKNNTNWKGGITGLRCQIWKSEKYKKWRGNIFKKFKKTCQKCGSKKDLQVHHSPYEFAEILRDYNIKNMQDAYNCENLWEESNGIVLCAKCHRKTYKFKGNQYATI